MLHFLDRFFLIFHFSLVLFNLFGWIWKKTRVLNLITLALTGLSWFVLGIFYGIGYCPLTDWHWKILIKLGATGLPNSYMQYLLQRIFSLRIESRVVDTFTLLFFLAALSISVTLNAKDMKTRRYGKGKGKVQ